MDSKNKALLKLHFAVFLAGTSGLFGRWVTLSSLPLVWYRVLFSLILLSIIRLFMGRFQKASWKTSCFAMFTGVMLAFHWLFFFASIKQANVSIGVVCLSVVPFITALLEPLLMRTRFSVRDFLFSILSVAGIVCIYSFDTGHRLGILFGMISSTLLTLMIISNKRLKERGEISGSGLFYHELIGGLVALSVALVVSIAKTPDMRVVPEGDEWWLLLLLAGIVTLTPYILKINALEKVSAFTVNLANNMEPVYSIFLAAIFFSEMQELTPVFFIGLALIVVSVALQTIATIRE